MSRKSAETIVKRAVSNTHATVRKQRNRRPVFKAWTVSALLEQYRDPRAILLEIASMDTAALAKTMNASLADALAERRLCAQAVLPYVAQKLPAQIDLRTSRTINLNIVDDRQYKELVEIAATEADDADSFSMTLLGNATDDSDTTSERPANAQQVASERPVTPPVPPPPTEAE